MSADTDLDRGVATLPTYRFREVTDAAGLKQLFELRYQCFRNSRYEGLVAGVDDALDIDQFDSHSRHYGLFYTTSTGEHLIGSHRHVTDRTQPAAGAIDALVSTNPELESRIINKATQLFPVLTYFPEATPIIALYQQAERSGETFIEASRLACWPEFGSLSVVKFIVMSTLAAALANRVTQGITAVNSRLKRFYAEFGFHSVPSLPDRFVEKTQCEMSVLVWDGKLCSADNQREIGRLVRSYKSNGHLEFKAYSQLAEAAKSE